MNGLPDFPEAVGPPSDAALVQLCFIRGWHSNVSPLSYVFALFLNLRNL
jgi:hypothetical protein